jgi:hypothetical protein
MAQPRLVVEALEPRLLHAADLAPLALDGGVQQALHASFAAPAALTTSHAEIVFRTPQRCAPTCWRSRPRAGTWRSSASAATTTPSR